MDFANSSSRSFNRYVETVFPYYTIALMKTLSTSLFFDNYLGYSLIIVIAVSMSSMTKRDSDMSSKSERAIEMKN